MQANLDLCKGPVNNGKVGNRKKTLLHIEVTFRNIITNEGKRLQAQAQEDMTAAWSPD